jgi:hypothetical protein
MTSKNILLDLNNADRKLLTQLPAVSKDVAYRIVNYRNAHGGFRDWTDVEDALGFTRAEMDTLKQRAFLGPRPAPVTHERQMISRWRSKADDKQHGHG